MGLIITLIALSLIIACIAGLFAKRGEKEQCFARTFTIAACVSIAIVALWLGASALRYMYMKGNQAEIEACLQEAKLFVGSAVNEFKPSAGYSGREITDLKFNAYQEKLSSKLASLRWSAISYNKTLIGKRIFKNSWFIGPWLTVGPDPEMELYKLPDHL